MNRDLEDLGYVVLVRITACYSAPNPIEEEVRRTLKANGYECTVANISYPVRDLLEKMT